MLGESPPNRSEVAAVLPQIGHICLVSGVTCATAASRETGIPPSTPPPHSYRRSTNSDDTPHTTPPDAIFSPVSPPTKKRYGGGWRGVYVRGRDPLWGRRSRGDRGKGRGDACKFMVQCSISIDMRRSIVGDYRLGIPLLPCLRSGSGVLHVWRPYNGKPPTIFCPFHVERGLHLLSVTLSGLFWRQY